MTDGPLPLAMTTIAQGAVLAVVMPCVSPACKAPARLYAGGWRCGTHLPLPFTSAVLGQDTREVDRG